MLLPDDDIREVGNFKKAAELKEICELYGWYSFSMENDFKTIYGDGVERILE